MRTKKLALVALVTVLAVAGMLSFVGVSGASSKKAGHSRKILTTRLTGEQEVPGPGDEDGVGFAEIRLGEDQVCFRESWKNIDAPTMSHIHVGPKGVAGPIVVVLFMAETPLPDTIHSVDGCAPADPAVIHAIAANPSGYYVNIHNVPFPAGAIRGQLK
jgi:CHRD domain